MIRNAFTSKLLCFSAEAFLNDMDRRPIENDWIYKVDGLPIVQSKTSSPGEGNGQTITLGRIKGTDYWVFPEWCKEI